RRFVLENLFPFPRDSAIRPLVSRLEWYGHIAVRLQEEGHIRQRSSDGCGLHVSSFRTPCGVCCQGERFAVGQFKSLLANELPDRSVNPLRVAAAGGEEIDD